MLLLISPGAQVRSHRKKAWSLAAPPVGDERRLLLLLLLPPASAESRDSRGAHTAQTRSFFIIISIIIFITSTDTTSAASRAERLTGVFTVWTSRASWRPPVKPSPAFSLFVLPRRLRLHAPPPRRSFPSGGGGAAGGGRSVSSGRGGVFEANGGPRGVTHPAGDPSPAGGAGAGAVRG